MSRDKFRAFIAIELPDQLKTDLENLTRLLDSPGAEVKWVGRRQMHLTLKFLGDITSAQAQMLRTSLEKAVSQYPLSEIQIGGIGAFPTVSRPKVIWVGVKADRLMLDLQDAVEQASIAAGIPAEQRAFKPHLTLGRVKYVDRNSELPARIRQMDLEEMVISIPSISLIQSSLTPKGPVYTILKAVHP